MVIQNDFSFRHSNCQKPAKQREVVSFNDGPHVAHVCLQGSGPSAVTFKQLSRLQLPPREQSPPEPEAVLGGACQSNINNRLA